MRSDPSDLSGKQFMIALRRSIGSIRGVGVS